MPHDGPDVIFQSGADQLQLEPGGPVYRPGDVMPKGWGGDQRLSLQRAGFRFETRHAEPMPVPAPAAEAEPVAVEQPRRAAKGD